MYDDPEKMGINELILELEMHRHARLHRLRRRIESEIEDFITEEGGSEIRLKSQELATRNTTLRYNFTDERGEYQNLVVSITEIPQDDDRFRVAPMQV